MEHLRLSADLGIVIQTFVIVILFFFFNDTATTEIYTLSLHDALPISVRVTRPHATCRDCHRHGSHRRFGRSDRKSTRLNSSHSQISYAVFCLKKKKNKTTTSHLHTSIPCLSYITVLHSSPLFHPSHRH